MTGTVHGDGGGLGAQLAHHGGPLALDLSDERQYAFVHETWETAGRTREHMPNLFDALERTRAIHRRAGGPPALPGGAGGTVTAGGPSGAQAAGTTASGPIGEDAPTVADISGFGFYRRGELLDAVGSAVFSARGGRDYVGLTLQLLNADTEAPLGPVSTIDEFGAGFYEPIQASGPVASEEVPLAARFTTTEATSAALVEQGAPPLTLLARQIKLGLNPATPPRSTDPLQKPGRTVAYVMICLLRAAGDTRDCDYGPYGSNETVVPVKGQISYKDAIVKPFTASNAYAALTLVPRRTGGGAVYKYPGNLMQQAFRVEADGRTLSWNMQPAKFGVPDPFQLYETVDIMLKFGVTTAAGPELVWAFVSSGTVVSGPSTESLKPLQFATGCVASSTLVTLADGSARAIETLRPGECLRSGPDGAALTVHSTSSGPEPKPLVWLRTERGCELFASEGHPVLLAAGQAAVADVRAGGAKMAVAEQAAIAAELRLGDRLLTPTGPQRIVALERRPYDGLVWNMQLGTPAELARRGVVHGTFYAGGILVGDARMQTSEGERRNASPPPEDVLARLPRVWHEDYHTTLAA
jgi:hypothetical protein